MTHSYNIALAQIGERIYRRREELGMSGTELSLKANLTASSLSKIENGRRNIGVETLCSIARALEVPLSLLQPEDLDAFNTNHSEIAELEKKIEVLQPEQRTMVLTMFHAQLDALLRMKT